MEFVIRKIPENDIGTVIALMREFAEYENLSEFCEITEETLSRGNVRR